MLPFVSSGSHTVSWNHFHISRLAPRPCNAQRSIFSVRAHSITRLQASQDSRRRVSSQCCGSEVSWHITRRQAVPMLAALWATCLSPPHVQANPQAATNGEKVLYVLGSSTATSPQPPPGAMTHTSLAAALTAVSTIRAEGHTGHVTLEVAAGSYQERLILTEGMGPLTIRPWPQGVTVEVSWFTSEPYESVVDCTASGVVLQGLTLRHGSKSVANNYGVFIREKSDLRMVQCDISSSTGSGVGIEGASPQLEHCKVHGCARHGVAVFGPLDPLTEPPGGGVIRECEVYNNGGEGVLVRDGAAPTVTQCDVHDNKGWGIFVQSSGGELAGNRVARNSRGAVQSRDVLLDVDLGRWRDDNSWNGSVDLAF